MDLFQIEKNQKYQLGYAEDIAGQVMSANRTQQSIIIKQSLTT